MFASTSPLHHARPRAGSTRSITTALTYLFRAVYTAGQVLFGLALLVFAAALKSNGTYDPVDVPTAIASLALAAVLFGIGSVLRPLLYGTTTRFTVAKLGMDENQTRSRRRATPGRLVRPLVAEVDAYARQHGYVMAFDPHAYALDRALGEITPVGPAFANFGRPTWAEVWLRRNRGSDRVIGALRASLGGRKQVAASAVVVRSDVSTSSFTLLAGSGTLGSFARDEAGRWLQWRGAEPTSDVSGYYVLRLDRSSSAVSRFVEAISAAVGSAPVHVIGEGRNLILVAESESNVSIPDLVALADRVAAVVADRAADLRDAGVPSPVAVEGDAPRWVQRLGTVLFVGSWVAMWAA